MESASLQRHGTYNFTNIVSFGGKKWVAMCHTHENTESDKGNCHDNKFISPRFLLNRHDAKIRQYPDHGMQYWIAWKNRPLPFSLLPPMKVQDLYM
jgi:hypothetical protein